MNTLLKHEATLSVDHGVSDVAAQPTVQQLAEFLENRSGCWCRKQTSEAPMGGVASEVFYGQLSKPLLNNGV